MTGDAAAGSRPPDAGMETEAQRRSGWLKWRKITRLSRGALEERAEWRAAPCASVRGLGAGGFLTCKTPDETTYFAISIAKRNGTDQKRRGLRTPQGQNLLRKCNNLVIFLQILPWDARRYPSRALLRGSCVVVGLELTLGLCLPLGLRCRLDYVRFRGCAASWYVSPSEIGASLLGRVSTEPSSISRDALFSWDALRLLRCALP